MSLIVDHSGKVHESRKKPTLKDVICNKEAAIDQQHVMKLFGIMIGLFDSFGRFQISLVGLVGYHSGIWWFTSS